MGRGGESWPPGAVWVGGSRLAGGASDATSDVTNRAWFDPGIRGAEREDGEDEGEGGTEVEGEGVVCRRGLFNVVVGTVAFILILYSLLAAC